MPLLSRMIRNVAITGRTDTIDAWVAGRQGGRWAEQTIRAAFPRKPDAQRLPPADPAEANLYQYKTFSGEEFEAWAELFGDVTNA